MDTVEPFDFDECLRMELETSKDFVLDHDAVKGEIPALAVQLSQARPGVAYSILRNGRTINVHCYIPKVPV
jgi:hypothetical protein